MARSAMFHGTFGHEMTASRQEKRSPFRKELRPFFLGTGIFDANKRLATLTARLAG
jgi:hypothetical protein